MESPAEQSGNATEIGKRELRSVRRRLVQSTLLPHKPQEQEENGGDQEEESNGSEEEELCGSRGSRAKKKRKSKGKTTPQSRSSKKQAKEKRTVNLTPKKILHAEEATPTPSPTIPDLRLEAKKFREENSRMFAGREIHPFFSSLKGGRKSQEATQSAERGCTVERKESGTDCNPIHVYERTGDDELSPDWQNWTFLDRNIVNNDHTLQNTCSSVFGGCVKSLSLDDLPIMLPASGAIEEPMDHGSVKQECSKELTSTVYNVDADKEIMLRHLLSRAEVDGNLNKTRGLSDVEARPILEHQSRFLQDRMQSYYLRCQSRPKNCLWTYKYQPKMAIEVCGNLESVKFLSEWLHLWYERNSQNNKDFAGGNKFQKKDDNGNCSQSDSDYESSDGEDSLKNVLLVTGSSGSGKSAAIYACAEEHGFKVFEFSASVIRSGAVLKQMIGEVLHSHQLKWSVKNSQGSRNNSIEKCPSSLQESTAVKYFANEAIELIPLSDDDSKDHIKGGGEFEYIVSESTSSQGEAKALILLEDVDIIFREDRGFISAIQEIAGTGKGPIILTSNRSDPVLPDNLDRLQVSFIQPSSTELLSHLYMICASEGVIIQPSLLERIIHCYHKDIRKTIMHLQFWCQGKGFRDKIQKKYGSLLFDLDAGHQILPVIMPWSFPSQLSELVNKEITKSLLRMETTSCLLEASEGGFYDEEMQNGYQNYEDSYLLEAKKAAMLSRNGSIQDHNEFAVQFDAAHECSDTSGTPIPLSRQKRRRRLDIVVSSDSEDVPINKECSLVPNKDDSILSTHQPAPPNYPSPLNGLLYHMTDNTVEDHYPYSETAVGIDLNEMLSITTSYVPESIFVPETEIHDMELFPEMVSHGDAGASPEVSMNELFQNVLSVEANSFDSPTHTVQETTAMLENTCNVFNLSRQEGEGFACNGHMENIIRTYPVMDECSRVDFNKSKFTEKPELNVTGDSVHELWKQLRLHHLGFLGHHVMPEKQETVQVVELVHRMSHLISDSDLLLSSCQPQDILETTTFVSEEPDSFFWGGQQLQMSSTIAQHGFCSIASDISTTASRVGFDSRLDIVPEMLASTTKTAALGKLMGHNMMDNSSSSKKDLELRLPGNSHMQERDMKSCLLNVIQHVAPNRLYLALKGEQFFEYLSSLRCISRSETLRISKRADKTKRRRGRAARHYLSTGSHLFSPEGITLLEQSNLPYKDIQGCE